MLLILINLVRIIGYLDCMKSLWVFLSLLLQKDKEFLYYRKREDDRMQLNEIHTLMKTHGQKQSFKKNMRIFKISERPRDFYLLEEGWIKISQEGEDGQAITLALRKSGDLFGLVEILAREKYRLRYAYSLTDITVYALSAEKLYELIQEDPNIMTVLCTIMAQRLLEAQNFIKVITSMSVPHRLAWFLQLFSKDNNGVLTTELPLTHEEISYILGCSRQKITSFLNRWRKQGYITYKRGIIEILDQQAILLEE